MVRARRGVNLHTGNPTADARTPNGVPATLPAPTHQIPLSDDPHADNMPLQKCAHGADRPAMSGSENRCGAYVASTSNLSSRMHIVT